MALSSANTDLTGRVCMALVCACACSGKAEEELAVATGKGLYCENCDEWVKGRLQTVRWGVCVASWRPQFCQCGEACRCVDGACACLRAWTECSISSRRSMLLTRATRRTSGPSTVQFCMDAARGRWA